MNKPKEEYVGVFEDSKSHLLYVQKSVFQDYDFISALDLYRQQRDVSIIMNILNGVK